MTGRPLRWTEVVFEHVGSHGLAIVSNGALVWDVARDEPRTVRPMDAATALAVSEDLRAAVPGTTFAVESLDGIDLEPGFMERAALPAGVRRAPIERALRPPGAQAARAARGARPGGVLGAGRGGRAGRLVVTWSSTTALLEISAPGVTKASTLAQVAAELGVEAADVIAFGDMPNDLPMLTWAGTSYAMADAHPSVVAAADHLAPGHDDDGVAQVLAGVFDL